MKLQHMTRIASRLAVMAVTVTALGCTTTETGMDGTGDRTDYARMKGSDLGEYLVLESGGFLLDQPTQEGGTARDRMVQDEMQKICSESRNQPSPEQAGRIISDARASMKYPQGGIMLGDWNRGGQLAWGGFGFRLADDSDDHSRRQPDGACYNCHALSPARTGGTLGPSLTGYGKSRGNSEATRRFVYEMIYNPHAYFPCTNMPRLGSNGVLDEQAIADISAYVLHPDSPVNR